MYVLRATFLFANKRNHVYRLSSHDSGHLSTSLRDIFAEAFVRSGGIVNHYARRASLIGGPKRALDVQNEMGLCRPLSRGKWAESENGI